jgi:hypothetical protein
VLSAQTRGPLREKYLRGCSRPGPDGSYPAWAGICPILPHPSKNPRRGDELLSEYDLMVNSQKPAIGEPFCAHQ